MYFYKTHFLKENFRTFRNFSPHIRSSLLILLIFNLLHQYLSLIVHTISTFLHQCIRADLTDLFPVPRIWPLPRASFIVKFSPNWEKYCSLTNRFEIGLNTSSILNMKYYNNPLLWPFFYFVWNSGRFWFDFFHWLSLPVWQ